METFLREPGRKGKPALGFWCGISHPLVAEALAAAGPDYVCVDMQHGANTASSLVSMLQAVVAGGSAPIVRVPSLDPAAIMLALDSGARGVIVPLIESAEQAATAVAACRYPPYGNRSFGPFRASLQAGSSDPRELEKVACIVMIETRAGIENMEAIIATEGVTAAYVGPSDLSLALGLAPGSIDDPAFVDVRDRIVAACARHGVVAGMHCASGEQARAAVAQGFGMATVAGDLALVRQAVAAELGAARGASMA